MPLTAVVIITRANCKGKHRTSICEKMPKVLLTTNDYHVTYHLAIIDIEGIRGGASYASSTLIDRRNKKTIRKQCKSTETMSYASKLIPVYSVEIRDSDHEFKLQTEINKLEKSVLLELPNPEYQIMTTE